MAEQIDRQMGQRIATARRAAGLTLRELAARLGWPYTTLGNYEEGRRPIKVAHLVAIAAALSSSPAALLVDLPEAAAIINAIDGDIERCIQVAYMLETLDAAPMGEYDGE
jgi:transcriptional regulator with XRE-family HTH domain